MKTIAYLRVSKDSQDVKNQRLAILEFARQEHPVLPIGALDFSS